jgi:hypothetical protein
MDFTPLTKFVSAHWLEIGGICTLGFSLWIAFGPLRHRLPKPLTRLGKYSATLKLLFLSGVCWVALFRFLNDDIPSAPVNWMVGGLGVILLLAAAFVITRKQTKPAHSAQPMQPSRVSGSPSPVPHQESSPVKPVVSARSSSVARP